MNKIVNINLGGLPFNIDEDAYAYLSRYLNSIHSHFEASEGYDEITTDIEIRVAELFQERMGSRSIVTKADVEAAISVMGTPEDFGAESIAEEPLRKDPYLKTGKRFFRNEEDGIVGGVCSGLAAYLGIKDPLWLRLLLVVLVLSSVGFLIPAYLIAWAIVPSAKTAADRLAMRGEPINASNIGKIVETEMKDLSERISEIGDGISEKFKGGNRKIDGTGFAFREAIAGAIYYLGKSFSAILQFIVKIGRPMLMLISLLLCLALLLTWVTGFIGVSLGLPISAYIVPNRPILAYLGVLNVFSIVTIPFVFLVLLSLRLWSKARLNRYLRAGMLGFFVLNVISISALGSSLMRDFQAGTKMTLSDQTLTGFDTLRLSIDRSDDLDQNWLINEQWFADEDRLFMELDDYEIVVSKDDQFHLKETVYARGRSQREAKELAYTLDYQIVRKGNELILPGAWSLPKGNKYRGQEVRIEIAVPENAHLLLEGQMAREFGYFSYQDDEQWNSIQHDRTDIWRMTADGLVNLNLEKASDESEQLSEMQ